MVHCETAVSLLAGACCGILEGMVPEAETLPRSNKANNFQSASTTEIKSEAISLELIGFAKTVFVSYL